MMAPPLLIHVLEFDDDNLDECLGHDVKWELDG